MSPDDPRHGTNAGYQAHARDGETACDRCLVGRRRTRKRVELDRLGGEQFMYGPNEIAAVLEPWTNLGLSFGAITAAAGLGSQYSGCLYATLRGENGGARRGTYRALARITEDDFAPGTFVFADLTRRRVLSLQAAGHRLVDMPIASTGRWRTSDYVKVFVARNIRDFFQRNEFTLGGNRHTANRALNAGHVPPLAWDDPGTLAWPTGSPLHTDLEHAESDDVTAYVGLADRILAGDWRLPCSPADKAEVIRLWHTSGRSMRSLQRLTGWKTERYYKVSDAA